MLTRTLYKSSFYSSRTLHQKLFLRSVSGPAFKYKHQDQLYLHKKDDETNAHLLSFSDDPSDIIIGTAFLDSIESDEIVPDNFELNKPFEELLHSTIAEHVKDDFSYLVESKDYSGEHMPIYDLRNVPEYQRVPDTEDIFGFVRCDEKGEVVPGSYQANNIYTVVSRVGPLKLTDHLHEKVLEAIKK